MGFAVSGRYILSPVGTEDGSTYVELQLQCLAQTYNTLVDPEFGARQRTAAETLHREFAENIVAPGVRAFFAYENPQWTPTSGTSCTVGTALDWGKPVGFALSRPGPLPWEYEVNLPLAPEGTRDLTHLYTLESVQGTGLGAALFDAVLYPDEPAYLWYIIGNQKAVRFYEQRGFEPEGSIIDCGGAWGKARTARMVRGLSIESSD